MPCCARGVRGGSWNAYGYTLRSSTRTQFSPALANDNIGFRVASPLPAAAAVPTVSEWGLIVMGVMVMVAGVFVFRRFV